MPLYDKEIRTSARKDDFDENKSKSEREKQESKKLKALVDANFFETYQVRADGAILSHDKTNPAFRDARVDSENLMLTDLIFKINQLTGKVHKLGDSYDYISGNLKIISSNPFCSSCQGVITQFHAMFPKLKIKLIDGIKYK